MTQPRTVRARTVALTRVLKVGERPLMPRQIQK